MLDDEQTMQSKKKTMLELGRRKIHLIDVEQQET